MTRWSRKRATFHSHANQVTPMLSSIDALIDKDAIPDWSTSTRLDAGSSFPLPMEGFTRGCRGYSDLVYRGRP